MHLIVTVLTAFSFLIKVSKVSLFFNYLSLDVLFIFTFLSIWEYATSSIILMRKFRVFILEYDFMFPERSQLFYLALWTAEEPSLPITWVKVSFKEQVCGEFQDWDLTGHSNYYSSLPFADCLAPTSSPSGTHTEKPPRVKQSQSWRGDLAVKVLATKARRPAFSFGQDTERSWVLGLLDRSCIRSLSYFKNKT